MMAPQIWAMNIDLGLLIVMCPVLKSCRQASQPLSPAASSLLHYPVSLSVCLLPVQLEGERLLGYDSLQLASFSSISYTHQ